MLGVAQQLFAAQGAKTLDSNIFEHLRPPGKAIPLERARIGGVSMALFRRRISTCISKLCCQVTNCNFVRYAIQFFLAKNTTFKMLDIFVISIFRYPLLRIVGIYDLRLIIFRG